MRYLLLISAASLLAALCIASPVAAQTTVTLTAVDSKGIASVSNANWNDNRLRAYWNNSSQGFLDGFVKFDLSTIPDTATITAMTMTTWHESGFGNPFSDPEVRCYRVGDDTWTRGATNSHPGLNESLTGIHTGFPTGDLIPWDWVLDVSAASWSGDLADDTLSLALRNEAGAVGRYSFVYWYGSDALPAPPELEITYADFRLALNGACPGPGTFIADGATPLGDVAFIYAFGTGSFVIPAGFPCAGTTLGLSSAGITLAATVTADASGIALVSAPIPAGACGNVYVQAVDLTTCATTNVLAL